MSPNDFLLLGYPLVAAATLIVLWTNGRGATFTLLTGFSCLVAGYEMNLGLAALGTTATIIATAAVARMAREAAGLRRGCA